MDCYSVATTTSNNFPMYIAATTQSTGMLIVQGKDKPIANFGPDRIDFDVPLFIQGQRIHGGQIQPVLPLPTAAVEEHITLLSIDSSAVWAILAVVLIRRFFAWVGLTYRCGVAASKSAIRDGGKET